MKQFIAVVLSTVMIYGVCFAGEKSVLNEEKDKISYSIGYQMGSNMKSQGMEIDQEILVKGIQDGMSGTGPLMSPQEMNKTLVELRQKILAAQQKGRTKVDRKNLVEGKAFLEKNGKKDGIKTLPSGLQYKVLKEGEGQAPKASDTVTVHYRGTLINGTEFDSSYSRGEPTTFQLNRVIRGWTEGLQIMKPGAKYQLFIPPELAYGERDAGAKIGPNSTLIFEVELISVKPTE